MATTATLRLNGAIKALFTWPITLGWRLATLAVDRTGIFPALILGLGLMLVGWLLCSSLIGIVIGLPMAGFGVLLLIRALY